MSGHGPIDIRWSCGKHTDKDRNLPLRKAHAQQSSIHAPPRVLSDPFIILLSPLALAAELTSTKRCVDASLTDQTLHDLQFSSFADDHRIPTRVARSVADTVSLLPYRWNEIERRLINARPSLSYCSRTFLRSFSPLTAIIRDHLHDP